MEWIVLVTFMNASLGLLFYLDAQARRKRELLRELKIQALYHDLSGPISSLQCMFDLIDQNYTNDQITRLLSGGQKALEQITRITAEPAAKPFSVEVAIKHAVEAMRLKLACHKINLETDLSTKFAVGDQVLLERILLNLLSNSLQELSCSKGLKQKTIRIRSGLDPVGRFYLSVQDNGRGIKASQVTKISHLSPRNICKWTGLSFVKLASQLEFGGKVEFGGVNGKLNEVRIVFPNTLALRLESYPSRSESLKYSRIVNVNA